MLKILNEKAETFNRNNLYIISENISDLGLQINPNNIDLLTEKSISNSNKGFSYINTAIDNNDKILYIDPNNFSAKLNKINNISNLSLNDLKQKYIYYLIEIITNTTIINKESKLLIDRAISVMSDLIKKYGEKIYIFLQDQNKNYIFPKIKLLEYCFQINELEYNSSELLKTFYSYFKGREILIIDNNEKNKINIFWKLLKK